MTRPRIGLVLAAGKGTRMKSDLPKVLHPVLGKPMIQRVLENLAPLNLDKVILIVGHQAEQVKTVIASFNLPFPVEFVVQEPQLGTGHALMQVLPVLPVEADAEVLITCGDMPLVPSLRYQELLAKHIAENPTVSMVTVAMPNPTGYGRVVSENGSFIRIVEEKDASPEEKKIPWVNAGIYYAHWTPFASCFSLLTQNNAQGEFYLTDVLGLLAQQSELRTVNPVTWPEPDEVLGINSRQHLAEAGDILSRWTADRLMTEGVSLVNPSTMALAPEIQVGAETTLLPGCTLIGNVRIGQSCEIGPHTTMRGDITIGNHCKVLQSFLDRLATVGDNSLIGPFAHLRDNAVIGEHVKIGNFVEMKETTFGNRSAAAHLCYLGDVVVGEDVNMGAGSIIANYDPVLDKKCQTVIEDGVKVGCNSVIVAPVKLGERTCVAAGSVITDDAEPWDLVIARARQTAIPRWVEKKINQNHDQATGPSCTLP
jgi:bifunctional UDP-N-acetylglucosamine pyrophosphorylase / glucosamine-1-phosphate N-acetyltransferase